MKKETNSSSSSSSSTTDPIGQNLIKVFSNVCFSFFVFSVLLFTVIAITYQPPDPWLQSSQALTRKFTESSNATFATDTTVINTGEDIALSPADSPQVSSSVEISETTIENSEEDLEKNSTVLLKNCDEEKVNCSDPRALFAIEKFNLKAFKYIRFLLYQTPVNGSKTNECDVSWRYRNKKEKSWRKYRDFRRFTLGFGENCSYEVIAAKGFHSGVNARPLRRYPRSPRGRGVPRQTVVPKIQVQDEEINDTIPVVGSDSTFQKGKYLYYSHGGDCKNMNHFLWSFLCGLGEAQYLNRTFVMDLNICFAATHGSSEKDEVKKDFRYYFDFEHLKEVASIVEEQEFLKDWKKLRRSHLKISMRNIASPTVTPMQLRRDKSTVLWRRFDQPEPDNYWYRVCEGRASKFIQRPWHAVWKSKRLMNIVSEISGQMDWDFDAVHVVRGEKAQNKELWPHLDSDTSPDNILTKVKEMIVPSRNLFIATNEPFYNYFDKLRSEYKVHLLDDYKDLWSNTSEWYNETTTLNRGTPVEFDQYMRVAVDTEVLYRAKTKVETFYNLTSDCKDGVNTC